MALECRTIESMYDLFHQHIIIEPIRLTCRLSGYSNFDSVLLKGVFMSYGFVYVMANESLPNLYKIGYTTKSPMARANELSRTNIPNDYYVVAYAEYENVEVAEKEYHLRYANKRFKKNKEFFEFTPEEVWKIVDFMSEEGYSFSKCDGIDLVNAIYLKDLEEKEKQDGKN